MLNLNCVTGDHQWSMSVSNVSHVSYVRDITICEFVHLDCQVFQLRGKCAGLRNRIPGYCTFWKHSQRYPGLCHLHAKFMLSAYCKDIERYWKTLKDHKVQNSIFESKFGLPGECSEGWRTARGHRNISTYPHKLSDYIRFQIHYIHLLLKDLAFAFAVGLTKGTSLCEEVPDEPMQRCSHCGRSFWAQRLQVQSVIQILSIVILRPDLSRSDFSIARW